MSAGFAAVGVLLMAWSADAEELTGRHIIDIVRDRQEADYDVELQTMTLIDKKGNREVRDVRRYARKGEDGQYKYLVVFRSPAGVKGVALLTWHHRDVEHDQWLYLPAQGDQVKRVARNWTLYFMGTDYTYEDLLDEPREKYAYTRRPDEALDGVDHFVVEIVASNPTLMKETGYQKRTVWVHKDHFYVTRTDYVNRQGKLVKREVGSEWVNVEGLRWRARETLMENFSNGHSTRIHVEQHRFEDSAVPEEYFTQRFLLSGQHIR